MLRNDKLEQDGTMGLNTKKYIREGIRERDSNLKK